MNKIILIAFALLFSTSIASAQAPATPADQPAFNVRANFEFWQETLKALEKSSAPYETVAQIRGSIINQVQYQINQLAKADSIAKLPAVGKGTEAPPKGKAKK